MSEEKAEPNERTVVLDRWSPKSVLLVTVIFVAVLAAIALASYLVYTLSFLLFLVVISIFFAYLLDPLVKAVRKPFVVRQIDHLMPRPLAIVVSYLLVFAFLFLILSYVFPLISAEISEFVRNIPTYSSQFEARIRDYTNSYRESTIPSEFQEAFSTYVSGLVETIGSLMTGVLGFFALSLVTVFPWIILVPVLTFFFLKDAAALRLMFLSCFPSGTWRARVNSLVSDVNTTLAAYTRAMLISCVLIGLLCTLAFTLLGLKYSLLLGLFAGILEFIPLLGPLTVAITAVVVALFFGDPWQAFWTLVFLISLRLVHDYYTYPRIVRDGIHLHPLAVILSVLAGEQIAGVQGVFLSIPIIALVTVFYKHILKTSGRTSLFSSSSPESEEALVTESQDPA